MTELDCQDYKIIFGSCQKNLSTFLSENAYTLICVLVDENTHKFCFPKISEALSDYQHMVIEISSGEDFKNLETCQEIYSQMLEGGADRQTLMVNLGGGVIGDMGGFCASTYMRGIDFIQIPTTLLSQVDSSVGGKLGVDFEMVKNIVGVFNNPERVLIDPELLKTLDTHQVRSGFAEMIKHGLIADEQLYEDLFSMHFGLEPKKITTDIVYRAIQVKKRVVEKDPFEKNLRKILNFGHTLGHAIETESWHLEKPLLHGEAIIVGMICENYIAYLKGLLTNEIMERINQQLKHVFYRDDVVGNAQEIISHMKKDKKNQNKRIFAALIDGVGSAIPATEISEEEVLQSLSYYKNM